MMGKFKVKKSGLSRWLHKKFNSNVWWNEYGQISLCFYFWNTLFQYLKAVGFIGLTVLALMVGFGLLWSVFNFLLGVVLFIMQQFYLFDNYINIDFFVAFLMISIIALIGLNLKLLVEYLSYGRVVSIPVFPDYIKKWFKKTGTATVKEKQPNMLIAYLKAVKQKIYPLVEFED